MAEQWGSKTAGAFFTRSPAWEISIKGPTVALVTEGKTSVAGLTDSEPLKVQPGYMWSAVTFCPTVGDPIVLDGIPNASAKDMLDQVGVERKKQLALVATKKKLARADELLGPVMVWAERVSEQFGNYEKSRWWIPEEVTQQWVRLRNQAVGDGKELNRLLADKEVSKHVAVSGKEVQSSLEWLRRDLGTHVAARNEVHFKTELVECHDFLEKVEKTRLTDEQAKSVICFDNRVMSIAAAGSGKTSTMVAKAGYALHRKITSADKILMLAFNSRAAEELQERANERLAQFGVPTGTVKAQTFHGFGLSVIGRATGKKPSLASWVEKKKELEKLAELIDTLKDSDATFRTQWDLFRLVLGREVPAVDEGNAKPIEKDAKTKPPKFFTLKGEFVRSHGERMIADWLFYNGVEYEYEKKYEHDTATETHRQYAPDFYYPRAKLYHEHWALDGKGNPPKDFKGYREGMLWKQQLHKQYGTALIETTTAGIHNGSAFATLQAALEKAGAVLDPNPDREVPGRKPIANEVLVKRFRTFLSHAKSNCYSDSDLYARLKERGGKSLLFRHAMFLDLFVKVRAAWQSALKQEGTIDFDDMLNLSAEHIEAGRWTSPYDLVMVDEFQDASNSRARLVSALVKQPGKFLFAVGDDWQSINRFAGADLSVITDFERRFGKGQVLRLTRTFRCSQELCNISSQFVLKNKAQLSKPVNSETKAYAPTLEVRLADNEKSLEPGIRAFLDDLCEQIKAGQIDPARKGKISVFALGRYNQDENYLPSDYKQRYGKHIDLKFVTVHRSKGLEADYVIMPRVAKGRFSVPSTIEDDPVFSLAMPNAETYESAEERRLFYVALTRARRSVTIFSEKGNLSSFVTELIHDLKITPLDTSGAPVELRVCPGCKEGSMKTKVGDKSDFSWCSRYPQCEYNENVRKPKKRA
jgi:DNA helicase-4